MEGRVGQRPALATRTVRGPFGLLRGLGATPPRELGIWGGRYPEHSDWGTAGGRRDRRRPIRRPAGANVSWTNRRESSEVTDDQRWTTSAFVLLLMAAWQLWAGFTDWTSSFERALSTEATLLFGMALFAVMAWVQQRSVVSTYALMLVGQLVPASVRMVWCKGRTRSASFRRSSSANLLGGDGSSTGRWRPGRR